LPAAPIPIGLCKDPCPSLQASCPVLDQGYQGVSGSIRNQDQGWGYQGSLISGSRVKSGSGQRPAPGSTWLTRIYSSGSFFLIRVSGNASGLPKRRAVGRREEERRDLGPCENVEKVITKGGKATSEKRWACKFCDRTLQGGPNIIMAHRGVHGSGKKKDVQRCRHAPPDARARRTSSFAGIVRNAVQSTEFWQEVDIFVEDLCHVARQ
jgi:hypothetical protein